MSLNRLQDLQDLPCAFNMKNVDTLPKARLKYIEDDINKCDTQNYKVMEVSNYTMEEKIRDKNLLTWVKWKKEEKDNAKELNNSVLKDKNICALASRFYMYKDDATEVRKCYDSLQELKGDQLLFDELYTKAMAEQAYFYSRLGSFEHNKLSIELYEKAIDKFPEKPLWIFGLGLVNRRMTYFHMQAFYPTEKITKYASEAKRLLLKVIKMRGPGKLKCMAYSQLAIVYSNEQGNLNDKKDNIQPCVDNVLQEDDLLQTPSVLYQCSKSLMDIMEYEQAQKYLLKSIEKKETSYAHLLLAKNNFKNMKLYTEGKILSSDDLSNYKNILKHGYSAYELSGHYSISALLTCMKVNLRLKMYEEARENFEELMNNENAHNLRELSNLREAHDIVSQCREDSIMIDEHKTKAISLDADLLSSNPNLKQCTQKMWDSISAMSADCDAVEDSHCKFFMRLVIKHKDVTVVTDFINTIGDHDKYIDTLKKYLKLKAFENALAFINLAHTYDLRDSQIWTRTDFKNILERTYLSACRCRLERETKDSKRPFQQMFKLVYGHCTGFQWDQSGNQKRDVLLFNDGSEEAMTLSSNLKLVFDVIFGLDANVISWADSNVSGENTDIILQEIMTYSVVAIVLKMNSSEFLDMLTKTKDVNGVEFRVIKLHADCLVPEALHCYPCVEISYLDLHYKNPVDSKRTSLLEMFCGQFNGVIKLFKFVVKRMCPPSSEVLSLGNEAPQVSSGKMSPSVSSGKGKITGISKGKRQKRNRKKK